MACRINSAHVCQLAKSVISKMLQVLQAKDTSANRLLKPGSKELSRIRRKNKNISPEKHYPKESKQESTKVSEHGAENDVKMSGMQNNVENKEKYQTRKVVDNEISPSNIFEYFRKLYDEEETKKLCLHLQPSNIKPFGTCGDSYTPTIFKRRSSSADCQYFSKSSGEKMEYNTSCQLSCSHSNYADLRTNNQKMKSSVLDDILKRKNDAVSKPIDNRIFSAPEPASTKYSEGDSSRFISSFAELLEEKSLQTKSSNNKTQFKITDPVNGTQGDMSIISSKPSNPKLFGSRFNRSPLIGPQYLQDNYANLRSVCGVIRTNDTCAKVTIKKITKKKKTLPKLSTSLMKCPSVVTSLTKLKNVTLIPLKKKNVPQDPVRCEKGPDKEICKRSDDEWKLTPKPFSKISDCPKVPCNFEMKCCAPLSRLPKVDIPEPVRKCEQPISICAPRSDKNLLTCKRQLPQLPSGNFCRPNIDVVPGEPIRRLKKFSFQEPPKLCPKQEEPVCERSDGKIEVLEKCLPEFIPKCPPPPVEDKLMDGMKLKRLQPRKVTEVHRHCVKPLELCDHPIRSDDHYKLLKKRLPKYEANKCKMTCAPSQLKEGDNLQRPQKLYDPKDPKRECKTSLKCVKEIVQVERKNLPDVSFSGKATFPQLILKEGIPLKRMEKKKYSDPKRICPIKVVCDRTIRADAKLSVKKSCLPRLQLKCPAPSKFVAEVKQSPLKRLPKVIISEPKRVCLFEPIINKCERADANSSVTKKCLPILKSSNCSPDFYCDELRDSPSLKRLTPKKISETRECPPKVFEKCIRSDMDDWDYIIERSCYPIVDKCRPKSSGNVNTKRSMSTNLSSQLNRGLLVRRAQLSHIDVRKRFSNKTALVEKEKNKDNKVMLKAEIHSTSANNCDKDRIFQKDLQPQYPLYGTFEGVDPIKPEAPILDASKEDDCIREKYKIPNEGVTATCDNPNAKQKFLRVQKKEPSKDSAPSCSEVVVKSCSSPPGPNTSSSCDDVVKSCPSTSNSSCSRTFSPKHPCPPPCPPICTKPKSCPKFKNVCGKKASLWQRIKNYFKARPNCPPPGAYKKKKLVKKVLKLADRAGLGVYDPCDDPKLICREVERRCCLAKKSNCGEGRRCLHSFAGMGVISSITPFVGILPINERIIARIYILNRRIAHMNIDPRRKISSWKNPYEFYNFDRDYDAENLAKYSSGAQKLYSALEAKALYLYDSYSGIDIDSLRANMFKHLFITTLISFNLNDEEFEADGNAIREYGSQSIECKKELLMKILHKIQQNLETISKKNLINWEEKDSTQETIMALGKILDTRNKR